jgi:hypothetical protein
MAVVGKIFTILSDSKYIDSKVLGLIRHFLTIVGTILLLKGVGTAEQIEQSKEAIISFLTNLDSIIGEFLILVSQFSSWFAKEKQK